MNCEIGVPEKLGTAIRSTVLNYSTIQNEEEIGHLSVEYGDTITVTLQMGENRIWKFSQNKDTTPPIIETAGTTSATVVEIKINEPIDTSTVGVNSFK